MVRTLTVGRARIGSGRCFVIAEAGVNHNGDPALAERLVDAAADAGADAVKFQTFDPDLVASAEAAQAAYQEANTGRRQSQRNLLAGLTLPLAAYPVLRERAERRGLEFLSSPFDLPSAEFLVSLGVPAIKVASGEITNLPFLRAVATLGRPLLVSTGMSTLPEVAAAVTCIRDAGCEDLALFHCVSNYPASPTDCNLRAMATMRSAFGVPVGWSDHTEGTWAATAAVALGAELVEKHLTIDRGLPGPDHRASLEPGDFAGMVAAVRRTEAALGTGEKMPTAAELPVAALVRRGLRARHALRAGDVLAAGDIVALRPAVGLSPAGLERVVGRRLARNVAAGAALEEPDLA